MVSARLQDHRLGAVEIVGIALDANERSHPRTKLVGVERLGDEIVGARVEALDSILGLLERHDQHHRNQARAGLGLERAADVEAAWTRHHDVEQDEIRRRTAHALERSASVRHGFNLIAVARQERGHEVPIGLDVVDYENAADSNCVADVRGARTDATRHMDELDGTQQA